LKKVKENKYKNLSTSWRPNKR